MKCSWIVDPRQMNNLRTELNKKNILNFKKSSDLIVKTLSREQFLDKLPYSLLKITDKETLLLFATYFKEGTSRNKKRDIRDSNFNKNKIRRFLFISI